MKQLTDTTLWNNYKLSICIIFNHGVLLLHAIKAYQGVNFSSSILSFSSIDATALYKMLMLEVLDTSYNFTTDSV